MGEQAALHSRTAAAASLTEYIRELKRYKDKDNISKRLLEQKFSKVVDAKNMLIDKHYYYAEKTNEDLGSQVLVDWITPKLDECNDIMDEVFVTIEELEAKSQDEQVRADRDTSNKALDDQKRNELVVAEKQSNNDEEALKDRITMIMQIVSDNSKTSKEYGALVEAYLKEVDTSLEDQIKSWNTLKLLTTEEEKLANIFGKEMEVKKLVADRRSLANAFINKVNPQQVGNIPVKLETQNGIREDSSVMKLEKMKTPTFSGNSRAFARFKSDFEAIVAPSYPNKIHQTFVLKENCLQGQAKKLVENMDDISDIWERLQTKYGDNIEIVNLVIKDIEKLSLPKYDQDLGLVSLVDVLEKGLQDLTAIGARSEIANAYTVKLLETKLPRRVLAKWIDKDVSTDSRSRFDQLLDFLKQERRQAERLINLKDKTEKGRNLEFNKDERRLKQANAIVGNDNLEKKSAHNNNCLIHTNSSHLTRKCRTFLGKTVQERGKIVKDANACRLCLSVSHCGEPCPFETKWDPCKVNGCKEYHSRLVHGCGIQGIAMYNDRSSATYKYDNLNNTLLLIENIKTLTGEVVTFWDNGSTLALVARSYAQRMNLKGVNVCYDLITVGGHMETQNTILHEITLLDRRGNKHLIKAYQIDEICGEIKAIKVDSFMHLFPSIKLADVARQGVKVELLIGMEYATLHPQPVDENEGIVLYDSQFGTGKILGGSHQRVHQMGEVCASVKHHAHAQLCNVRVSRVSNPGIDFFTSEDFGVKIPSRCNRCKDCKECKYETHQLSRIEQQELSVIRENLQLDPIKNCWSTKYPYKCDPNILENNRAQSLALLKQTEKRLSRSQSAAEKYSEQFEDFIKRGVITEISEKENKEYAGPVFYVCHHEVFKPGSSSTPVRLVINSSLKYNGVSLNDILMKGPNALNDLFGIQLRFRIHIYAMVCDIQKMYHSIFTSEVEKHIRRMLWRNMKIEDFPKIYGIERVMFGDKPAAAISSVAIQETAEIYRHVDEVAAQKIKEDVYVDDIVTGDETREKIESQKQSITDILAKGGFKIKGFVTSGDQSSEVLALLGAGEMGRVLGICWDPTKDEFSIEARVNLSKKYKGERVEPDYMYEQIPQIIDIKLTRRTLLGVVNSCYDPLGLLSPITIQLKIELRSLYNKELNLGWDDPIPRHLKANWVRILQLLKSAEKVRFPRCIKPKTATGDPELIMCNDGSVEAMCSTAHIRWKLESGEFECSLWTAKSRVTPLQRNSIPRIEMQSAVMSTRLSKSINIHSGLKFKNIIHILDSKCTMATLHKDTMALREYMGNRVSEILETTDPGQWHHVCSKENISDLGTRSNATVEDISKDSEWQKGPPWMRLEMNEWPTSQDISGTRIPEEELMKGIVAFASNSVSSSFNIEHFRGKSYNFLLRVIATVIKMIKTKSFKVEDLTSKDIDDAERFCIKLSMKLTREDLLNRKLTSLRPQTDEDGVIVISSRANEGLRSYYGRDRFPILTYRDPLSYIWIEEVHNEDHTGITRTVAKSRGKYWIVKARKLAEKVKASCYRCRLIDKSLAQQQMAPLPKNRLAISPTFYITSLDLFGPIEIKDTVKQRSRKKVWGVIFNCTSTRAIYLDLTEDYGTDSILQTIRRFMAIRGCPAEIISDQGSQLKSAAKDITELMVDWKWKPISTWASNHKIKWTIVPAEGQHQNGLSESLIKSVKRTIKHKVGPHILTFSQLQMIYFEIANIINSRPIGIISGSDPDHPNPITPNDLILGRSTSEVPQGPFDSTKSASKRFRFLQNLVTEWWDCWYQTVLPSLVPSYKWLQRHRNVQIGDVCLIRYGKDKRATYRLGRVKEVKKGADNLVRKVILNYKLPDEKIFRTVDRPIHGIAVIVPIEEQSISKNKDVANTEYHNKSKSKAIDGHRVTFQLNADAAEYFSK